MSRINVAIVVDAVRCAKIALDRGISGQLDGPSAYFMKSPANQHSDDVARDMVEAFIAEQPAPLASPHAVDGVG